MEQQNLPATRRTRHHYHIVACHSGAHPHLLPFPMLLLCSCIEVYIPHNMSTRYLRAHLDLTFPAPISGTMGSLQPAPGYVRSKKHTGALVSWHSAGMLAVVGAGSVRVWFVLTLMAGRSTFMRSHNFHTPQFPSFLCSHDIYYL